MTTPTKRKTSRPVPTELHALLLKACPPGEDGKKGSIRSTLAPALGVVFQYVYRWIEENRLPAKFVKPIVKLSEGRVTKEDLIDFVI